MIDTASFNNYNWLGLKRPMKSQALGYAYKNLHEVGRSN